MGGSTAIRQEMCYEKIWILILLCVFTLSALACGTGVNPNETTTLLTQPEETTIDTTIILNELSEVPSIAVVLNGERQELFESLVCAHVNNSGVVADGVLILQSLENVLGYWVSEGNIPTIILDAKSELVNVESNVALTDPITFHIYEEVNGTYNKITSLEKATIADVYNYGVNNLKEKSAYIRFDISKTTDGGNATYAYIMHVDIKNMQ